MRYVDISKFKPQKPWLENAKNALNTLRQQKKVDRSEFINSMRDTTWKDAVLNQSLIYLLSNRIKKCWYSETSISGPVDIDHYRPKGTIKVSSFYKQYESHFINNKTIFSLLEEENENGWWFLAFDYKNFRVCNCSTNRLTYDDLIPLQYKKQRANGKSNFFPLKKGSSIALTSDGVIDEEPCLLDPCNKKDPEYLSFDHLGHPFTRYKSKWVKCRVEVSIAVYHLMEIRLIEHRKERWQWCQESIVDPIKLAIKEKNSPEIIRLKDSFFANFADKSKEYSAVAIDCIKYNKISIKNQGVGGLYNLFDKLFPEDKLKK
jgi:hypothetical protein